MRTDMAKTSQPTKNKPRLNNAQLSKEVQAKLSAFVNSSVEGFALLDEKLNYMFINPVAERMIGVSKEAVVGKNVLDIVPDVKETGRYDEYLNVLKTGEPFSAEDMVSHTKFGDIHANLKAFKMESWLGLIATDITERKRVEEAVKAERQRFNDVLEMMPVYLLLLTPDYHVPFANRFFRERFGESHGRRCFEYLFGRTEPCEICEGYKVLKTMAPLEWEWTGPDGRNYYIFDFPFTDTDGSTLIMEVGIDITERKKVEEQLKTLLKEKEALLSEVNHRVKNNFQLISSLLDMVGMRARNEETIRVCASVHARVHAMGLIHSQLYQSGSFAQIDMEAHVKELVGYLAQVYATNGIRITPVIDASGVYLSITPAVPCALALNEIISNAFKHAFQGRQKGTIEISLRKSAEGMVTMRVKDDGIGMPEDFDIDKTSTLGLKLTRNLVQEQLKGSIQFRRGNGTEVTIEFKVG
jgi:PAS domain S-box-containing protein